MSTSFPTSLDDFSPNPTPTSPRNNPGLAEKISDLSDAMEAVEAKVGVDSSAVTTSLDYRSTNVSGMLFASGVPAGGTGVNGNLYTNTATGIVYRKAAGSWSAIYTPAVASSGTGGFDIPWALGVNTMPRSAVTTTNAVGTGFAAYTGFVPQKSFTAASIRTLSSTTSSPSSAFVGLYSIDSSGNGTRIAVSATNTSLGNTSVQTTALLSPVALTQGLAYAVAVLFVGASWNNYVGGNAAVSNFGQANKSPMLYAFGPGAQTTLPASFLTGGVTYSSGPFYAEILA